MTKTQQIEKELRYVFRLEVRSCVDTNYKDHEWIERLTVEYERDKDPIVLAANWLADYDKVTETGVRVTFLGLKGINGYITPSLPFSLTWERLNAAGL